MNVWLQADGLEDLRAAVALQRRDAHLRHHLQHALVERLDVVLDRLVALDARQHALPDHVVDRLERDVRVDHAGAVAEQQRDVVHFARVARLDDQRAARARALAHQVMVHAGGGQQARNRRQVARRRRGPTGSGCRSRPPPPRWPGGTARPSPCSSPAPSGAGSNSIDSVVDRNGSFGGRWRSFATCSLWMIGYLMWICRHASRLRLEQVALGPDRRPHRRDQLLADRVERRVRHLREQLLEVVVEQPRPVRQHGQRRVGAHRPERLFAGLRHRRDQQAQVLLRVAERLLPREDRLVLRLLGARRRQRLDVDQVRVEPLAVRDARPPARA